MRAKCRPSARASRRSRSRWNTPRKLAAAPAPRPGGGCQFLGTAATSQVVARSARPCAAAHRARALRPANLARCCRRSARALLRLQQLGIGTRDILTDASIRNAMMVHAAFGGSTNLLLHVPAIAHAAVCGGPRRRLGQRQPPGPAPGRRAAQRPAQLRHRAGLSRRRRAGSHAASAPRRPARYHCEDRDRRHARHLPRLVGAERAPPRAAQKSAASRTASTPTT